jgi:cytoskeletal protein CcmA (bactofilin family)
MAIFGKTAVKPVRPETRSSPVVEAPMSIISSGMKITGDLECAGVVKVDGSIEGSVTGARQVLLGRGGVIHGNMIAEDIVIGGVVEGSIIAAARLELQATATVNGDIDAKSIVVIAGAQINGAVRMSNANAAANEGRPEPLRIATGT